MYQIDKAIFDTDKIICKNISKFDATERGLLSQNILSQLRNYVEYIFMKIYADESDINPNDYDLKQKAIKSVMKKGNLKFLYNFHELLQASVSHYTLDEDCSERLMLKYYEYLLKIKIYLKDQFKMEVLKNIDEFPLNLNTELMEYYKKIAEIMDSQSCHTVHDIDNKERYYIYKIKPFFVHHQIYYEVTLTQANDRSSKLDRVIAFTKLDIIDNYAVRLSFLNKKITILHKDMPIKIIDQWEISIRPCEITNFIKIFGRNHKIQSNTNEYQNLMEYMSIENMNLIEFITSCDYEMMKQKILETTNEIHFMDIFDKCRILMNDKEKGHHIIRYLLYKMNNNVIKNQFDYKPCKILSDLYLKYGCNVFDTMPFASSLVEHNPKLIDLIYCIDTKDREHEFFARHITNNIRDKGILFTPIKDLKFQNIEVMIEKYNARVYYKHTGRYLKCFKNHIYMDRYTRDCKEIVIKLKKFSKNGISDYADKVDDWLLNTNYQIDCPEKEKALKHLFSESCAAFVYGAAGTGKSTFICHISKLFNDKKKLYLTYTNPANDNLKRKIKADHCTFKTITSFLSDKNQKVDYDLLVIDECSTVSNNDMRNILDKIQCELLVLVGDVYQIEAIEFGNWFHIVRSFIPKKSVFELENPYRTSSKSLLLVWERVRELDKAILEPLVKNKYSLALDESIFQDVDDDQIILCLNYDGLYGINNINRFLQENNPCTGVQWGISTYKVGDPVLFNDSNRFTPLIYNNMKGLITDIQLSEDTVYFEIEVDKAISKDEADYYDFKLVNCLHDGKSVIGFTVKKYESDDDNDSMDTVVPFQVAYAVSIHKAQGLEYNSVKIVITNEVGDLITHNIFYTAITRARKSLKIYWSPETEKQVLSNFKLRNYNKDLKFRSSY